MIVAFESLIISFGFFGIFFFKNKKGRKLICYSLLIFFSFFLCISYPTYIEIEQNDNIETPIVDTPINLRESGFWVVDHIEINQNDVLKTWEVINQTYPWCSGNGTIDDPYIIENVSINAFNYEVGISISNSKGIYFIIKNRLISNANIGIRFDTTDDGSIINNTISNNNETGIFIHNCKRNNVIGNIIQNNSQYGVLLNGPNSKSNNFYRNMFIENGKHALDDSKANFNSWYNSSIGNYWDNYTGKDANDDHIGDIPYTNIFGAAGAIDNYPIWWDAPFVSVIYPLNYSIYSKFAPDFKVIIDEGKGDTFWYELAGKNSTYVSLSGLMDEEIIDVFDQNLWSNLSNGLHNIRFYTNDSQGILGKTDVLIKVIIPSIENWWNVSYSFRTPIKLVNKHKTELPKGYSVNISINTAKLISEGKLRTDGKDLRIVWYNGSNNSWMELDRVNKTSFNSIDTRVWFKTQTSISPNMYDGHYYLYYGSKDSNNPPTNKSRIYDFFDDFNQSDGPAMGWTVINGTWSINNSEYIENEYVVDGRSLLNSYTIENASIEVRVKSNGGNFGAGVMFRHADNDNFYTAGIGFWEYECAIGKWTNNNPQVLNYTLNNEVVLVNNQWYNLRIEALGSQYLVYLNDILKNSLVDADHLNASQIGFMTWTTSAISYFDDLLVRLLVSNEPILILGDEETFKPSFNNLTESADPLELGDIEIISVDITDLSGINRTFIEFEGIIHPMTYIGENRWLYDQWRPLSIGNYTYIISSENLHGHWNSLNDSIRVIDTTLPSYLDLNESSDPLELGNIEIININVTDFSGINQVLIEIEQINYSMTHIIGDQWQYNSWLPNSIGLKSYTIYFEDNNNNWNYIVDEILVVDTIKPSIIINAPSEGQFFGATPPNFNVRVIDNSLDKMWYTLNSNPIKYFFETNTSIEKSAWDNLIDGEVTITFFANDSVGNLNFTESILIYKDVIIPTLIINSPNNQSYWNTPPPINVTVFDLFIDTLWYRIGTIGILLTNNTEQFLESSIWENIPDESSFIINFFANDSSGNLNDSYSLTLYKDILIPRITIVSPENNTYWGSPPYINVTVFDPYLDSVWYEIGGSRVFLSNGVAEPLNTLIWQNLPDETPFTINFYANDSAGHITDTITFTLYKDITIPSLFINSPATNTYWNTIPPINITVYDPYLDTLWYRVGTINIPLSNNTEQLLDSSIWNTLPNEGAFT
ncbi:MAG: NosD domain-containing protein, partial [Promethearchaeota archaeon]